MVKMGKIMEFSSSSIMDKKDITRQLCMPIIRRWIKWETNTSRLMISLPQGRDPKFQELAMNADERKLNVMPQKKGALSIVQDVSVWAWCVNSAVCQ